MHKKTGEENPPSSVNKTDNSADDRSLVLSAQTGDKDAYGKLVLRYQKRLFRFLYMMLNRMDTVEDVVQEAFVKGYLALNTFKPDMPFYPWIATIARNLAVNHIKREERGKPVSEYDDFIVSIPDKAVNPLDHIIERENEQRFSSAVMSLPIQYRSVFVLRMFEKLSYEEIARQLNISVGTVDSRLHRARQKLVELLKDYL